MFTNSLGSWSRDLTSPVKDGGLTAELRVVFDSIGFLFFFGHPKSTCFCGSVSHLRSPRRPALFSFHLSFPSVTIAAIVLFCLNGISGESLQRVEMKSRS